MMGNKQKRLVIVWFDIVVESYRAATETARGEGVSMIGETAEEAIEGLRIRVEQLEAKEEMRTVEVDW